KKLKELENKVSSLEQTNHVQQQDISRLNILLEQKNIEENRNLERMISYQLGYALINACKSFSGFISLPSELLKIRKLAKDKKQQKLLPSSPVANTPKQQTALVTSAPARSQSIDLTRGLTLLDPISELCWADAFTGYPLVRKSYADHIAGSTCKFAFFESAWQANKGSWIYAFTSPGLKHNNAQALLDAIQKLKDKSIPIIFWNKEDPMHYEMFKPIAEKVDYVFTTDQLVVDKYKKELGHSNIWALPFAAPIKVTNPIGRFSLDTETVCFAGTYYAQNHENRKKQMDMLLPALLAYNGCIYDRASKDTSGKYAYPEQYTHLIREGVNFNEIVKLYKKFKVFLNVNTITQSTTMMSRRVYELLASGTPVVSTPSKAITAQFPGIVITVNNEKEAELAVHKLLTDSYYWHKQSMLGIREVMSKHTYENRWEFACSVINNEPIKEKTPSVRIIAVYHNYLDLAIYIDSLIHQNNVDIKEVVLLISSSLVLDKELLDGYSDKVKVVTLSEFNLKNYLDDEVSYTYFTDDNVLNYRNSIYGLVATLNYCNTEAVTRRLYYKLSSLNKIMDFSITQEDWYRSVTETQRNCVLIKNSAIEDYSINLTANKIQAKNSPIFIADP
ncbi:TPA: glycosyltransferase, partial [Mannheimia haemolytica]|nr:glycosyltransferase [Mannheimia haemolytica]